jgi:pimeloyl-ACP methyl ester carboxylesterase
MKEISFQLSTIRLNGIAFGDPKKPLILACHGWLDNAMSFYFLSRYLPDYYIVSIDLAGHGESSHRSHDAHYHFTDFVQDLHELVESQSWDNFILLGHSMGGMISTLYSATFPEHVEKLISIESFGPLTEAAASGPSQLQRSIQSRIAGNQRPTRHPKNLEQAISARLNATQMNYESAQYLMERNIFVDETGCQWRTDRRLRTISSIRLTDEQAKAFMTCIVAPMLVIRGTEGYDFMLSHKKQRSNWVTNLTFRDCIGGHHLHMDNPQEVAQVINEFLK